MLESKHGQLRRCGASWTGAPWSEHASCRSFHPRPMTGRRHQRCVSQDICRAAMPAGRQVLRSASCVALASNRRPRDVGSAHGMLGSRHSPDERAEAPTTCRCSTAPARSAALLQRMSVRGVRRPAGTTRTGSESWRRWSSPPPGSRPRGRHFDETAARRGWCPRASWPENPG